MASGKSQRPLQIPWGPLVVSTPPIPLTSKLPPFWGWTLTGLLPGPPVTTQAPSSVSAGHCGVRRKRSKECREQVGKLGPKVAIGGWRLRRREERWLGEAWNCTGPMRAPWRRDLSQTRSQPVCRAWVCTVMMAKWHLSSRDDDRRSQQIASSLLFSHFSSGQSLCYMWVILIPGEAGKGCKGEIGMNSPCPSCGEITDCSLPTSLHVRQTV